MPVTWRGWFAVFCGVVLIVCGAILFIAAIVQAVTPRY